MLVVDCGSGMTRGKIYSQDSVGVIVERWMRDGKDVRLPPVDEAIKNGPAAFLQHLKESVAGLPLESIVLGATGGLRKAIEDGKVTLAMVESFTSELAIATGAKFVQLSGNEEARLEYVAVRYLGHKVLGESVNMMSCGGASSQVAYGQELLSLQTCIIKTTDAILESGPNILDTYSAELEVVVNVLPAGLGGTFCMTEFFAVFVRRCIESLLGQILPVAAALCAIDKYLEDWHSSALAELRKPDDSEINDAGGVIWGSKKRFAVHGVTAVLLKRLLCQLRADSNLYFVDSWCVDGREIEVGWPLGLYFDVGRDAVRNGTLA